MTDNSSCGFYNYQNWDQATRIGRIKTNTAIFAAYAELHEVASIMAKRMDDVLDNYEHQMILREGMEYGLKMPDPEAIRAHNILLKQFLAASEPWRDTEIRDNMVCIPGQTARNLHMIAHQCSLMIDDVCRNIRETDYMLWFRTLRELDAPYVGPTSLQEMFNVWCSLVNSTTRQVQHGPERPYRLPRNWLNLVV